MNRVALVRDKGKTFEYLAMEYPMELHETVCVDPKTGVDERRYWKELKTPTDEAALFFTQVGWRKTDDVRAFLQEAVEQCADLSDVADLL